MTYLKQLFGLEGKVAIVTGASQGLGRTMALALAKAGADVAVVARTEKGLAETASRIREVGRKSLVLPCDVTRPESVQEAVGSVFESWGRIDALVNGAGIIDRAPVTEVHRSNWLSVVDTNLNGTFWMSQAVAKKMIAAGSGKIINIGSVTSSIGLGSRSAYSATKGAVVQLTRAMAAELGIYGICVNAIAPGFFPTNINSQIFDSEEWRAKLLARLAIKRAGNPLDLESAAIYLAGPGSDYVTGQVLYVDGGYTTTDAL